MHSKWRHQHPRYKADPYCLLTRREQVTRPQLSTITCIPKSASAIQSNALVVLAVRHNICCSPAPSTSHSERESGQTTQTTEHLLQSCPIYEPLRKGIWPDHTPEARKLYGSLGDLRCTAGHLHGGDWSFLLTIEEKFTSCAGHRLPAGSVATSSKHQSLCMVCHNETQVADQTCLLMQSRWTDSGPTSPSADPVWPGVCQGGHYSTSGQVTGKTSGENGVRSHDLSHPRHTPDHTAIETVGGT